MRSNQQQMSTDVEVLCQYRLTNNQFYPTLNSTNPSQCIFCIGNSLNSSQFGYKNPQLLNNQAQSEYKHSLTFRVRRYVGIATKPVHRLQSAQ